MREKVPKNANQCARAYKNLARKVIGIFLKMYNVLIVWKPIQRYNRIPAT